MGSKATLHKLCPVYFTVKNIPPQFRSKLDAIHIASLCYTDDLKTKFTDFNDIWHHIVKDVSKLEKGIDIGGGKIIRGTVTYFSSDNLGANTALGLVQNFSKAHYFCRFCLCSKEEIQTSCRESPHKARNKKNYEEQLSKINDATKVDYKSTKGIARYCRLNDLEYYHMFDSMVPDIMHDLNEGTIPFLLKKLFEHCIENKIFSEQYISQKIQYHDYGYLNKKNVPSLINISKENLNQNASQLLCLFRHIPYIFYEKKEELEPIWLCVTSLLKIVQISYSTTISEEDLIDLENCVELHLIKFLQHFRPSLRLKQHNMTHYASVIRKVGPIKEMSMMRFESKHQDLKKRANGRNFINLTKSICESHQKYISTIDDTYTNNLSHGVLKEIDTVFETENNALLDKCMDRNYKVFETIKVEYNGYKYRVGLFVNIGNFLYEIEKILANRSNIYFVLLQYKIAQFDEFLK